MLIRHYLIVLAPRPNKTTIGFVYLRAGKTTTFQHLRKTNDKARFSVLCFVKTDPIHFSPRPSFVPEPIRIYKEKNNPASSIPSFSDRLTDDRFMQLWQSVEFAVP